MSPVQYDHVIQLPTTPNVDDSTVDPRAIAQQWISSLETILSQNAISRLGDLFHEESWWRDMIALEWDFHTIHGLSRIQNFLTQNQPQARLSSFRLQDKGKYQPSLVQPAPDIHLQWVASMFFFETRIGRGTGFLRLTPNAEGKWKAYAVYTSLQELKGFDEPLGPKRVYGTLDSMPDGPSGGTWFERRQRQMEFLDEEPRVLLIGAGELICT